MKRVRTAGWFFALLIAAFPLRPSAADELVGKYQAAGTTPQGKPYSGEVQIEQLGGLHIVLWKLADGEAYKGLGIRQGDVLGAAYGPADTKFGIVVYQINGGTLTGIWADSRDLKSELGKETLQGDPSLSGIYNIILGQNRDGLTNYGGQVQIKHSGENYVVVWPTKPPAVGIGVRLRDLLVVAYSSNPNKMPGVVAYQALSGDALSGIWAIAGMKQTGDSSYNISAPNKVGREDLKRVP
jgi:hypothetical protein